MLLLFINGLSIISVSKFLHIRWLGFILRWADIEDTRILSKTYIDSEIEGALVLGYGIHGVGYRYTSSRTISYQKYTYLIIQIFHKWGRRKYGSAT